MTTPTTRAMTCDELHAMARDLARAPAEGAAPGAPDPGEPVDAELLLRAREHLRGCAACAQRIEGERRLDTRLTALAAREAPSPPAALEQRLLGAFRARLVGETPPDVVSLAAPERRRAPIAPPRATSRRWPLLVAGGLALAGAAAAAVWLAGPPEPRPTAQVRPAPPPPAFADERAALPIVGGDEPLTAGAGDLVVIARPGTAEARGGAFVPLGWDGDSRPIEIGRIARVRLPTALAARFGWPLLPDAPDARVAADVLVGEDGTARALRFLPATFTPISFSKEESP
jgi:hypothetical protein